jgi:hypothetical protein
MNKHGMGACLFLAAVSSQAVRGQEQAAPKPATKLEAFQAKTGTVVIRGYTTVGKVSGLGGDVTVDAREFKDGSNPNTPRVTGISVNVKETGRLERENTSFIDADEVDSLLKGIDYIDKITKDVTSLDLFEAEYRTKGDLRITVFNDPRGGLSVAVSSGQISRTSAYLKMSQLDTFRSLIVAAKSKI